MTNTRKLIVGSIIAVSLLAWLWVRISEEPTTVGSVSENQAREEVSSKESIVEGRGVQARNFDPTVREGGWVADGVDRDLLQEVLDKPSSGMDAALMDLQANRELVPWLGSLVADDDFGQEIARCRARYERHQKTRCFWYQDIVIRRKPTGEASVAAVRPRITPELLADQSTAPPDADCQAWAKCVAAAWKGRPGLFPEGADDYVTVGNDGSEYISLRSAVHHLEAYGTSGSEYSSRYRDRISRLEEKTKLREQAYLESEEAGDQSKNAREALYHNLLQERGWIADHRAYLEYLRQHES